MVKVINGILFTLCVICFNLNIIAQSMYDFNDLDKMIIDSMQVHQFSSMSIGIIKGNNIGKFPPAFSYISCQ